MNVWDGINNQIGKLHSAVGKAVSVQQGTVTSVSPLRVRPDFHTQPLAGRVANYCGPLGGGDRVLLIRFGRRAAVVGRSGGDPASAETARMRAIMWTPARPAGSLWPQGIAWDETVRQWYVALAGQVGGVSTGRIERWNESGDLVDFKEFTPASSSEGLPFFWDGGDLKFFVRVSGGTEYAIFNYTTGTLGPTILIKGRYKSEVRDGVLWTCDAHSSTGGISEFYAYDWNSVQAGSPTELGTVKLQYRCMYEKVQSFTIGPRGEFVLSMGRAAFTPALIMFNRFGKKIYAMEFGQASFADMVSAFMPGFISDRDSYRHESEGAAYRDGKLVTGHVVYNSDASAARFVFVEHTSEGVSVECSQITGDAVSPIAELPISNPKFEPYDVGGSLTISRSSSGQVEIKGALRTLSADWVGETLVNIPYGFRPAQFEGSGTVWAVCPATNATTFTCRVLAGGNLIVERYSGTAAAGQWLGFSIKFQGD